MKAGRELDALVAEKVFKMTVWFDEEGEPIGQGIALRVEIPHFSTKIESAWIVVEKMNCHYIIASAEDSKESWVHFGNEENAVIEETPLAICLSALLTLEDKTCSL